MATRLELPKIQVPTSIDDIPVKRQCRYPRKVGLNLDQETYLRWKELSDLNKEPADLVRGPVKQLIDAAYELVMAERERQRSSRRGN
jgi:hypothetical protein